MIQFDDFFQLDWNHQLVIYDIGRNNMYTD